MIQSARVLDIGQIEPPAEAIRFLFLPDRQLFARRAARLRYLADGHSLADYLTFLARLVEAQQMALDQAKPPTFSETQDVALCRQRRKPPLAVHNWTRDPSWRNGLRIILQHLQSADLPPEAAATSTGLLLAPEGVLETKADAVLAGDLAEVSPAEFPLVAAALQVYWLNLATALQEPVSTRQSATGLCPVCDYPPVAGVIHASGKEQGLRYLCCSLCGSRWHKVRLTCSSCDATAGINHFTLEGGNGAAKVESCDGCGGYLKLFYLEKDTCMEPVADDLATLALDMLMASERKVRIGPNLLLHPG